MLNAWRVDFGLYRGMGCVIMPNTSQVGNIRGHGGPINKLTFSPSGRELITASDDHKVKVSTVTHGRDPHI